MERLKDKIAIITGGGGGIGKAAGALFIDEGANVLLVDRDESALQDACTDIGSDRVSYCVGDVTSLKDNQSMVDLATERYGGIDILVANAGIEGEVAPITEYDEAIFDQVLAVNVKGPFLCLKAAIPALKERGGGSIIITSSVAGINGSRNVSAYVTSKHATMGLMKCAALECAPMNIRVNTVNPSPVDTRMMRSLEEGFSNGSDTNIKAAIESGIPLGRYGEPIDVAKLMLFLASDDSEFITGSHYMVDGGSTA